MDLLLLALGPSIDKAFYSFDTWVFSIFGAIQNDFFTFFAKVFTSFGDENFVIPMVVLGVILCFFKKTRKFGFALIFAIAIGTLVTNVVVKPMVLRIRPYNTLQGTEMWAKYEAWYIKAGELSESDYSFPSGHTTAAFEIAVAMGLCLRSAGHKKSSWIPAVIAVCTMCSRVYLMVHYPSDVVGGMLVGSLAGVVAFFLAKLVCKLFEKVKFLDSIDADKLFKKLEDKKKLSIIPALALVLVFFCISFIPSLSEGGANVEKCAYNEEYDCKNEAKCDYDENGNPIYREKYYELPGHEGKFFCKIHWKQLSGTEE